MAVLEEVRGHYGKLKMYINGRWRSASEPLSQAVVNPATGKEIGAFAVSSEGEVTEAIEAAQGALAAWKQVSLRDKARCLFDLRAQFELDYDRLCRILVQDHGRTIGEARGTLRRCIENIESACSALMLMTKGEYVPDLAMGLDQTLYWEPRGVFLIITPNNIPMHAWSSYVPYALASGCPVIVSPSSADPICAQAIFETVSKVKGFPPGLNNLIYGGRKINQMILEHPAIKGVGFIGSSSVGLELFAQAGRLGKEASVNGNGKNHVVLMPDADLNKAVAGLLRGCYGMAGQRCLGADNIVVIGDAYDEFKEKFVAASAAMPLGYGLDEATEMGPLVTEAGKNKVLKFIEMGLNEGARMILDGRQPKLAEPYRNGFFLGATIFEGVHPDMHIARQESFGPVANLLRADDLDQALAWMNEKDNYGHSGCIFTRDGHVARNFIKQADVGNVGVNVPVPQPFAFFPLGSKNESAFGLAKSRIDSMRLFLDQKTVTERWA
ncbi:MAG: aldehyde dehydrogenase family protein [Desulfobacterales bacterium]